MPQCDLYINPQKPSVGLYVRKSAIQLLPPALSCDVEFGTGFLPQGRPVAGLSRSLMSARGIICGWSS
jgi:hypothetical protein